MHLEPEHIIFIKNHSFIPEILEVERNTCIVLHNVDNEPTTFAYPMRHSAESKENESLLYTLGVNQKEFFTAETTGRYELSSPEHADMKCMIEVVAKKSEDNKKTPKQLLSKNSASSVHGVKQEKGMATKMKMPRNTFSSNCSTITTIVSSSTTAVSALRSSSSSKNILKETDDKDLFDIFLANLNNENKDIDHESCKVSEKNIGSSKQDWSSKSKDDASKNVSQADKSRKPAFTAPLVTRLVINIQDYEFSVDCIDMYVNQPLEMQLAPDVPLHAEHIIVGSSEVKRLQFESPLLQQMDNTSFVFVPRMAGQIRLSCKLYPDTMNCLVTVLEIDQPESSFDTKKDSNPPRSPVKCADTTPAPSPMSLSRDKRRETQFISTPLSDSTRRSFYCDDSSGDEDEKIHNTPHSKDHHHRSPFDASAPRSDLSGRFSPSSPVSPSSSQIEAAIPSIDAYLAKYRLFLREKEATPGMGRTRVSNEDSVLLMSPWKLKNTAHFDDDSDPSSFYDSDDSFSSTNSSKSPQNNPEAACHELHPPLNKSFEEVEVIEVILQDFRFRPEAVSLLEGDLLKFSLCPTATSPVTITCEGLFDSVTISNDTNTNINTNNKDSTGSKESCFYHKCNSVGNFTVFNPIYSFMKCSITVRENNSPLKSAATMSISRDSGTTPQSLSSPYKSIPPLISSASKSVQSSIFEHDKKPLHQSPQQSPGPHSSPEYSPSNQTRKSDLALFGSFLPGGRGISNIDNQQLIDKLSPSLRSSEGEVYGNDSSSSLSHSGVSVPLADKALIDTSKMTKSQKQNLQKSLRRKTKQDSNSSSAIDQAEADEGNHGIVQSPNQSQIATPRLEEAAPSESDEAELRLLNYWKSRMGSVEFERTGDGKIAVMKDNNCIALIDTNSSGSGNGSGSSSSSGIISNSSDKGDNDEGDIRNSELAMSPVEKERSVKKERIYKSVDEEYPLDFSDEDEEEDADDDERDISERRNEGTDSLQTTSGSLFASSKARSSSARPGLNDIKGRSSRSLKEKDEELVAVEVEVEVTAVDNTNTTPTQIKRKSKKKKSKSKKMDVLQETADHNSKKADIYGSSTSGVVVMGDSDLRHCDGAGDGDFNDNSESQQVELESALAHRSLTLEIDSGRDRGTMRESVKSRMPEDCEDTLNRSAKKKGKKKGKKKKRTDNDNDNDKEDEDDRGNQEVGIGNAPAPAHSEQEVRYTGDTANEADMDDIIDDETSLSGMEGTGQLELLFDALVSEHNKTTEQAIANFEFLEELTTPTKKHRSLKALDVSALSSNIGDQHTHLQTEVRQQTISLSETVSVDKSSHEKEPAGNREQKADAALSSSDATDLFKALDAYATGGKPLLPPPYASSPTPSTKSKRQIQKEKRREREKGNPNLPRTCNSNSSPSVNAVLPESNDTFFAKSINIAKISDGNANLNSSPKLPSEGKKSKRRGREKRYTTSALKRIEELHAGSDGEGRASREGVRKSTVTGNGPTRGSQEWVATKYLSATTEQKELLTTMEQFLLTRWTAIDELYRSGLRDMDLPDGASAAIVRI